MSDPDAPPPWAAALTSTLQQVVEEQSALRQRLLRSILQAPFAPGRGAGLDLPQLIKDMQDAYAKLQIVKLKLQKLVDAV